MTSQPNVLFFATQISRTRHEMQTLTSRRLPFILVLLMSLLQKSVAAVETECLSFLLQSDKNKDDRLNQIEYVTFVNHLSNGAYRNIFLFPFHQLPKVLQQNYILSACPQCTTDNDNDNDSSCTCDPLEGIDILQFRGNSSMATNYINNSTAMNHTTTFDNDQFCVQTKFAIYQGNAPISSAPISSPTIEPTKTNKDETLDDEMFQLRQASTPAPTPNFLQCTISMTIADTDKNALLDEDEYVGFINRLSGNQFSTAFFMLPALLQNTFDELVVNNATGIDVSGSKPGEDGTEAQLAHLETVCNTVVSALHFVLYGEAPPTTDSSTGESTGAPTKAATTAPTLASTMAPTAVPTAVPTMAPTPAATNATTIAPTNAPTIAATKARTITPTLAPTIAATIAVTNATTLAPTNAPTLAPTVAPTLAPTMAPTIAATIAATLAPTIAPTATPTNTTSASPTTLTVAPTQVITKVPFQTPVPNAVGAPSAPSTSPASTTNPLSMPSIAKSNATGPIVFGNVTFKISNANGFTASALKFGNVRNSLVHALNVLAQAATSHDEDNSKRVRSRRKLSVTYVNESARIDSMIDIPCPEDVPIGRNCISVNASFAILVDNKEQEEIKVYTERVQQAIQEKKLQNALNDDPPMFPITIEEGTGISRGGPTFLTIFEKDEKKGWNPMLVIVGFVSIFLCFFVCFCCYFGSRRKGSELTRETVASRALPKGKRNEPKEQARGSSGMIDGMTKGAKKVKNKMARSAMKAKMGF